MSNLFGLVLFDYDFSGRGVWTLVVVNLVRFQLGYFKRNSVLNFRIWVKISKPTKNVKICNVIVIYFLPKQTKKFRGFNFIKKNDFSLSQNPPTP